MGHKALPGHPELGLTEGIKFSSGRLGHVWGHVNGVAFAQPGGMLWTRFWKGNQSDPFHFGSQTFCVELVLDSECRTYLDSVPPCSVHTVASICQSNKSVWEEIRRLRHVAAIVRALTFMQSPSLVVLMFMCTDGQRSLQAHCSCTVATDRMSVNDSINVSCLPRPHGVLLQLGWFANGGQHLRSCEDGSRAEVGGEVVCSWVSE